MVLVNKNTAVWRCFLFDNLYFWSIIILLYQIIIVNKGYKMSITNNTVTIADNIRSIIYDKTGIMPKDDNADLIFDLNMDSLDIVELTMELEKVFNINIPDSIWQEFGLITVAKLVNLVEQTGAEANPSLDMSGFLREAESTQKPKNTPVQHNVAQNVVAPVQHNVAQNGVAPVQKTFKGLYTTSANGKVKCSMTGRPCQKIKPDEIAKNTQLLNLCRQHKCNIENNFQKIMQEYTK